VSTWTAVGENRNTSYSFKLKVKSVSISVDVPFYTNGLRDQSHIKIKVIQIIEYLSEYTTELNNKNSY